MGVAARCLVSVSPAPGYRDFGRAGWVGIARSLGNHGYSWSCTPVTGDVTVRYLGFATQNLTPSYAHNRGHGFQLRCLSEETAPTGCFNASLYPNNARPPRSRMKAAAATERGGGIV